MQRGLQWLLASIAAASSAACDMAVVEHEGEIFERSTQDNGVRLNGVRLNSFRLNGVRLNGVRLDGDAGGTDYIEITGITLPNGEAAQHSWLVGDDLHVQGVSGQIYSGSALVGTELAFGVMEGKKPKHQKKLRIDGVAAGAGGPDVRVYDIAVRESSGPWEPLCLDDGGNAVGAILLADLWDPATGGRVEPPLSDAMTFACRDAALGKCVEWGYRPWASVLGVALRDHHQACVRMVRADYCGDGVSHTLDGTPIHVLDPLGIQLVDPYVTYVGEAEWTAAGAICLDYANARIPDPALACDIPLCGVPFADGGEIQSGKIVAGP